jgi:hypothetical protein
LERPKPPRLPVLAPRARVGPPRPCPASPVHQSCLMVHRRSYTIVDHCPTVYLAHVTDARQVTMPPVHRRAFASSPSEGFCLQSIEGLEFSLPSEGLQSIGGLLPQVHLRALVLHQSIGGLCSYSCTSHARIGSPRPRTTSPVHQRTYPSPSTEGSVYLHTQSQDTRWNRDTNTTTNTTATHTHRRLAKTLKHTLKGS